MLNLIQADFYKMRKSLVIKILFGITTLCSLAMVIMAYLIPLDRIKEGYSGIGFMFSDINMMSILGAVIASIFICGDFDNKTIHDAISSGCSRGAIMVSKGVVFFFGLAFILLPYVIVTGIALSTGVSFDMGGVAVGFLHILTGESGIAFSASVLLRMLVAMLTLMIVYMAQLSICIPLAFTLRKPVLVIAIYYGFSILSGQLAVLSNSQKVFEKIYSCTPFGGNYTFVTIGTGTMDILQTMAVSIIFIMIMLIITYRIFRKSEIN
jgi:ABC-2 type transport system permease protein